MMYLSSKFSFEIYKNIEDFKMIFELIENIGIGFGGWMIGRIIEGGLNLGNGEKRRLIEENKKLVAENRILEGEIELMRRMFGRKYRNWRKEKRELVEEKEILENEVMRIRNILRFMS